MNNIIKVVYLYFFSFLGLILITIGGVRLSDTVLKSFVFREAEKQEVPMIFGVKIDDCEFSDEEMNRIKEDYAIWQDSSKIDYNKQQRQKNMSESIAFLIVGFPLYTIHRRAIKKI